MFSEGNVRFLGFDNRINFFCKPLTILYCKFCHNFVGIKLTNYFGSFPLIAKFEFDFRALNFIEGSRTELALLYCVCAFGACTNKGRSSFGVPAFSSPTAAMLTFTVDRRTHEHCPTPISPTACLLFSPIPFLSSSLALFCLFLNSGAAAVVSGLNEPLHIFHLV